MAVGGVSVGLQGFFPSSWKYLAAAFKWQHEGEVVHGCKLLPFVAPLRHSHAWFLHQQQNVSTLRSLVRCASH